MAFQILYILLKNEGEKKMRNFDIFFFFEMDFFPPRDWSRGDRGVIISRLGPQVYKWVG